MKNLNKIISLKLFDFRPYAGKENGIGIEYIDSSGGLYPQYDYISDFSLLDSLLEQLENKSIAFKYQTMKNGRRGHFVTLTYPPSEFSSSLVSVESEDSTLLKALCQAIVKIYI